MLSKVRLFSLGAALIAFAAFAAAGPAIAADETKRFDDWELQCKDRAPEGFPKCIITQNVVAEDSKLGVLSAAIYFRPGVNTPSLGFNLAPQAIKEAGMVLQIDTKPALELPIQSCNPNVCVVRATLRDQFRISRITCPCTSVNRRSIPELRNISRSWSIPSRWRIVA